MVTTTHSPMSAMSAHVCQDISHPLAMSERGLDFTNHLDATARRSLLVFIQFRASGSACRAIRATMMGAQLGQPCQDYPLRLPRPGHSSLAIKR